MPISEALLPRSQAPLYFVDKEREKQERGADPHSMRTAPDRELKIYDPDKETA